MKKPYLIGESANLESFPHGTKPGVVLHLTDAEAMYELDMGRITLVKKTKAAAKLTATAESGQDR